MIEDFTQIAPTREAKLKRQDCIERKSKVKSETKEEKFRQITHRIFTLSRSDTVLEATLFICIVGLTGGCGGVHKLLLGGDVVQTGAHT